MGGLVGRRDRKRERRDELLSAYLDDELNAAERARLEVRLAAEPALQAELNALRRTVALVRDLPPVPIPRNFILPQAAALRRPAALARPRRAWAAPLLTAATAVVSFLFAIILVGDLLLSGMGGYAPAPVAQEAPMEEPAAEVAEWEEVVVEAEVPEAAMAPSPAGEGVQVEAEKVVPAFTEPAEAVPEEAVPEDDNALTPEPEYQVMEEEESMATAVPAAGGGAIGETDVSTPMPSPPAAVEAPAAAPSPTPTVLALGVEEAAAEPTTRAAATPTPEVYEEAAEPALGMADEDTPRAAKEEEEEEGEEGGAPEAVPVAQERDVSILAAVSPWRVLEVVLGVAALGLALATVWAWRARRR